MQTVKHDFWAATGFYQNDSGERAVLKIGRTEPFCGFPLQWTGEFLCNREVHFYERLRGHSNIPELLGRFGKTGFLHRFIPGRPLAKDRPVPDGFFEALKNLLTDLHRRGIAYVDTNKPENILLGEDGRPWLIDFQISFDLSGMGDWFLPRAILKKMQREDLYHWLKHKRRMRPDELTDAEKRQAQHRSTFIRIHRFVSIPYQKFRKRFFRRMHEQGRLLPEGSK